MRESAIQMPPHYILYRKIRMEYNEGRLNDSTAMANLQLPAVPTAAPTAAPAAVVGQVAVAVAAEVALG
jgi:hypothetical protein